MEIFFTDFDGIFQVSLVNQFMYIVAGPQHIFKDTSILNKMNIIIQPERYEMYVNLDCKSELFPDVFFLRFQPSSLAGLIQLMPILIVIFLSVFSSLFVSDPLYSLQATT